jgi:hypothetical protein
VLVLVLVFSELKFQISRPRTKAARRFPQINKFPHSVLAKSDLTYLIQGKNNGKMKYWTERVIKPYCRDFGYKSLCEIGASAGGATDILLGASEIRLAIVDPCLDTDLCAKYSGNKQVTVHKGLSLEMIPQLSEKFDCILIDGDHNWYTVFHELKAIEERQLLANGGTIFFHDVGWPYGRRDMYYQPATVPKEFVHPHAQKGMIRGRSELSATEGTNPGLYNAETEGGEKNGVLTAIEDFLAPSSQRIRAVPFHGRTWIGGPG